MTLGIAVVRVMAYTRTHVRIIGWGGAAGQCCWVREWTQLLDWHFGRPGCRAWVGSSGWWVGGGGDHRDPSVGIGACCGGGSFPPDWWLRVWWFTFIPCLDRSESKWRLGCMPEHRAYRWFTTPTPGHGHGFRSRCGYPGAFTGIRSRPPFLPAPPWPPHRWRGHDYWLCPWLHGEAVQWLPAHHHPSPRPWCRGTWWWRPTRPMPPARLHRFGWSGENWCVTSGGYGSTVFGSHGISAPGREENITGWPDGWWTPWPETLLHAQPGILPTLDGRRGLFRCHGPPGVTADPRGPTRDPCIHLGRDLNERHWAHSRVSWSARHAFTGAVHHHHRERGWSDALWWHHQPLRGQRPGPHDRLTAR